MEKKTLNTLVTLWRVVLVSVAHDCSQMSTWGHGLLEEVGGEVNNSSYIDKDVNNHLKGAGAFSAANA